MQSVAELTDELRRRVEGTEGLGTRSAKLDLKEDGVIVIDGTAVTNVDRETDCTLVIGKSDLEALRAGKLNPTMALMTGKAKIRGDMSLMLTLQSLLKAPD